MKAIHSICRHDGRTYRGLHPVDHLLGEYLSESWRIADGNPRDLIGGWLYFHDSSRSRATFAARIIDVIPVNSGGASARVAFRIRRQRSAGQPWRGRVPTPSVPHGGIVMASYEDERRAFAAVA